MAIHARIRATHLGIGQITMTSAGRQLSPNANVPSVTTDPNTLPHFVTLTEWERYSGMGHRATYYELKNGNLHAKKLGKRTLIDLQRGLVYLRSLPDYKAA
jgi:hypothetical protein